jgi:hypothetical protein
MENAPRPCPLNPDPRLLKIGDHVRIRRTGVPYYPGQKDVPEWLAGRVFTVNGIDAEGKHGGVPCARLQEITSWCAMANLERVEA